MGPVPVIPKPTPSCKPTVFKPTVPGVPTHNPGPNSLIYSADLIVASVHGKTVVVKDREGEPDKSKIVGAICRLLSRHVFGNKFKMFVPVFEEDMKKAIDGVMDKHHIGFRSIQ